MKTVANTKITQAFYDCLVEGKTPIWLAKIHYVSDSVMYVSTISIKVPAPTTQEIYYPYVKEFGTLRQSVDEDDPIASPNEVSITLVRGSTTDALITSHQVGSSPNDIHYPSVGQKVDLWQWFSGLTQADKSYLGVFKITSIEDITQKTFTINCKEDQSYLEKQIPEKCFNKIDFPNLPDTLENDKVPYPIVLGDMTNVGSASRMIDGYSPNLVPFYLCNPALRQFLGYHHESPDGVIPPVGVQSQTIPRLFTWNEEMKMYAELRGFDDDGLWYSEIYTANEVKLRINKPGVWEPAAVGDARCIRIVPAGINQLTAAGVNTCDTYKNAIDFDETTVALLSVPLSQSNLVLGFGDMDAIGQYLPPYVGALEWGAKICFKINVIAGGGVITPALYYGGSWHTAGTYSSTGTYETTIPLGQTTPQDSRNMALRLVLSGAGSTASVNFVHIKFYYWDTEDILGEAPVKVSFKAIRTYTFPTYKDEISIVRTKKDDSYTVNQVFGELLGPSGLGFNYTNACNHLLFILHYMLGLNSSTDLDTVRWDSEVQSHYLHPHNNWGCAIAMCRQQSAGELITSLLRENSLKMWRDSTGKIRIFCWNSLRTATAPDAAFDDTTKTPWLISGFKWGWTGAVYNKFSMKYKYDNGQNKYQETYNKQGKDTTQTSYDLTLANSITAYGEKEYPYPECEWIRDSNTMELLYAELKRYWKSLKRFVEFDTSIVGCLLELGDSITVDHQATLGFGTSYYQVVSIEQTGGRVHVKAIEIVS